MQPSFLHGGQSQQQARQFYRESIQFLNDRVVPYLVGGAFALCHYTGIVRDTKDFDIFVRPRDCRRVLDLFAAGGYATELTFPHWLGKVCQGEFLIDVIFSSGNGIARVDEDWFTQSTPATMLGAPVRLAPVEEMIWSKGYIMERERFDGADIMHLLRGRGLNLDWQRLLKRFGPHWRVLLSHLVLFGFVYPGERRLIPDWVLGELVRRLGDETPQPAPDVDVCQGPLLSREQYLIDITQWHYHDARRSPQGSMTPEQIDVWTEAIETGK